MAETLIFGRAGIPIILQPDPSAGVELGAGAAFHADRGPGACRASSWAACFYGAGTFNHSVSTIPVVSGQLGLFVDYEVLP